MTMLLQDVVVTVIAVSAALVLLRNTVSMFRPSRSGPSCSSCGPACGVSQAKAPAATVVPLQVLRRHKT